MKYNMTVIGECPVGMIAMERTSKLARIVLVEKTKISGLNF